jgi:hypothetical protein
MKKRKVKRYDEGGKTEEQYKREGLAASNRDLDEERSSMSGLEKFTSGFKRLGRRLTEGNIDQPGSEAYYKYGAGRGKMIEESTKKVPEMSSDYSGRGATTLSETKELPKPAETTMSMTERLRAASPGSNIRRMDGEGGGYTSPVKEEVKEEVKAKRKPKKSKLQVQNDVAKRMARGYAKAAEAGSTRATGSGASGFSVNEDLMYPTKTGSGAYGFKKGGKVSSASSRADGIAQRGKTRGRVC